MFGYKILLQVAELGLKGDKPALIKLLQDLAVKEIKNKRHTPYSALINLVNEYTNNVTTSDWQTSDAIDVKQDYLPSKIWISKRTEEKLKNFIAFQKHSTLGEDFMHLNKVLLYGPPGTGKTTLGLYLGKALNQKVKYVKISDVVSSKFGETLKNIAEIFVMNSEPIIFIDEFDAFAKNRMDNSNDVGELKRIVSSIIQTLDFHSKGKTVIVATNLIESIDPAILRRFAFKIHVDFLTENEIKDFFTFLASGENRIRVDLKESDYVFISSLLDLKTVDEIRVFFEKVLISAHVKKKRTAEMEDFIEVIINEGYINKGRVKELKKEDPSKLYLFGNHLESRGFTKQEIASYLGIHRNSYNKYVQKV